MFTKRGFQLLLLVVAVLSVAQAAWWDIARHDVRGLVQRQEDGGGDKSATGGSSPPTSSSGSSASQPSSSPPSSAPSSSATPTSPPSSSSHHSSPSSKAPTSSSASVQSTPPSSSSVATPTSSHQHSSASEHAHSKTTDKPVSSSSANAASKTSDSGSDKTTASVTGKKTSTPGLSNGDSGHTSGMSAKTRNTIIGAVVGIGGAIVIGAVAIIAWRIWGRKKRAEENDGLMAYDAAYNNSTKPEGVSPSGTASQNNPFQSTLENYHQPGQVTASSNF